MPTAECCGCEVWCASPLSSNIRNLNCDALYRLAAAAFLPANFDGVRRRRAGRNDDRTDAARKQCRDARLPRPQVVLSHLLRGTVGVAARIAISIGRSV